MRFMNHSLGNCQCYSEEKNKTEAPTEPVLEKNGVSSKIAAIESRRQQEPRFDRRRGWDPTDIIDFQDTRIMNVVLYPFY